MSNKMKIIGLAGKAGSGKSYFADYLIDFGYNSRILSFATPIKAIATILGFDPSVKDKECRKALQYIGTEIGRNRNPDVWVEAMMEQIAMAQKEGSDLIVIDDVRFDNEAEFIINCGGFVVEMTRKGYAQKLPWYKRIKAILFPHKSERGISEKYIVARMGDEVADQLIECACDFVELYPGFARMAQVKKGE